MLDQKLLIVEDDFSSQAFYQAVLEKTYELVLVPTVDHAKKVLAEQTFDLAIIDISLPGESDGVSLMRFIRENYGDALPMVAITAHAFPKNKDESLAAGALEFLTKPIRGAALMEVVAKYINREKSS